MVRLNWLAASRRLPWNNFGIASHDKRRRPREGGDPDRGRQTNCVDARRVVRFDSASRNDKSATRKAANISTTFDKRA